MIGKYPNLPYLMKQDLEADMQSQIDKRVEEKITALRKEFDEKVEKRAEQIVEKEIADAGRTTTSSKIAKMIEEIKKRKAAQVVEPLPSVIHTPIPLVSPDQVIEDKHQHKPIDCPTCKSNGHVHHMVPIDSGNGIVKCEGPDCNEQGFFISTTPDYKCQDCGAPLKRPKDERIGQEMKCNLCGSHKAIKYNWTDKIAKLRATR